MGSGIAYNPIPVDGDQSIDPHDYLTWTPVFGAVLNLPFKP